jgi:putative ABC transport system permease protein
MYQELSYWQVAAAASLIVVNGVISILLGLDLHRRLLLASVRTVSQLLLVGLVLQWVFSRSSWYVVIGLMIFMVIVAGVSAVQRTERRFPGMWADSILSMWASSWMVAAVALFLVVDVEPWFTPQYAIPLLGMILGNTLTGISLGLDRFSNELVERRNEVEGLLALGATRWEAARGSVRTAVRTGMIPILNSMMVVGIVSLPGMMTGQLLAGVDPIQAVRYQVVIMFFIASATGLGTVGVVLLAYRRLFNARHQFRHGLLTKV